MRAEQFSLPPQQAPIDVLAGDELAEFASALIHSRQNISPRRLQEPGPSAQQLQLILGTAAAAPDHGQLTPWRFVIVPAGQRVRLAQVFAQALIERDPAATPEQIDNAREKAYRAPLLVLAVARLTEPETQIAAAPGRGAQHPESTEAEINAAERLVSLGCAIQNIVLTAHAAGFGAGLTSGQALASMPLRQLFRLSENEQAICCINIGTVSKRKPARLRPTLADYVSELD